MEAIASSSQRNRTRERRRNEKRALATAQSSLSLSSLPNDVVEEIFLRLPVKTLIRCKSLSKQWGSRIESHSFTEKHLKIAECSNVNRPSFMVLTYVDTGIDFKTVCSEGSPPLSFASFNVPKQFLRWTYVSNTCNGLFCIQFSESNNYVVNPATRWWRPLPLARFQILNPNDTAELTSTAAAFVKSVDYKLVWLYNSDAFSPNEGVTKCEIFDFRANAWRYLSCTPGYRITAGYPKSANGSVYWLTEVTEPYNSEINKVIALDIHTEDFRLLPVPKKIHANISSSYINTCTLDNRLCISKTSYSYMNDIKIWRLKSSEDMWEKIYTIDLLSSPLSWISDALCWTPVAICKNKKILISHYVTGSLVVYNPHTKSVRLSCTHPQSWILKV